MPTLLRKSCHPHLACLAEGGQHDPRTSQLDERACTQGWLVDLDEAASSEERAEVCAVRNLELCGKEEPQGTAVNRHKHAAM